MIDFCCVNEHCQERLHAEERHAGRLVRCARCGQVNVCPTASTPSPNLKANSSRPPVGHRTAVVCALLAALGVGFWFGRTTMPGSRPPNASSDAAIQEASQEVARAPLPPTGDSLAKRQRDTGPSRRLKVVAVEDDETETPRERQRADRQRSANGSRDRDTSRPWGFDSLGRPYVAAPALPQPPPPAAVLRMPAPEPRPTVTSRPLLRSRENLDALLSGSLSLATGTEWSFSTVRGHGVLRIENGTERDAVAALFDIGSAGAGVAHRAIYVRTGETATMARIAPGTYSLRFSVGFEWDEDRMRFHVNPAFSEFAGDTIYAERRTNDKIIYDEQRVTLHPVVHGTARTESIEPARFDLTLLRRVP